MKIKNAARTVIFDENDLIAIIDVRNGEYFKIPGGGIQDNESIEDAAKREALEEAGCQVELLKIIGEQQFIDNNPDFGQTTHHSVCFLAKKIGEQNNSSFDDWEKSNQMKLIWVTLTKAIELFSKVNTSDFFGSQINKRDFDFVLKAQEELKYYTPQS